MAAMKTGTIVSPTGVGKMTRVLVRDEKQLLSMETKYPINMESDQIIQDFVSNEQKMTLSDVVFSEFTNALDNIEDDGLILDESKIETRMQNYLFDEFNKFVVSMARSKVGCEKSLDAFETFLNLIIYRRQCRVIAWIRENTNRFKMKEQIDIINRFIDETELTMKRIIKPIVLCRTKCEKCNYLCLRFDTHSVHDCSGNHKCDEKCSHCIKESKIDGDSDDLSVSIIGCVLESGHDGIHDCKKLFHQCDQECQITEQCDQQCKRRIDHSSDEKCACGKVVHFCGKKCDYCPFECENKLNSDENELDILPCNHVLNHNGKHDCNQKNHQCPNKCALRFKGNCQIDCKKKIGHGEWNDNDDGCICQSEIHYCNEACDAPNCHGKCMIDCKEKHTRHDCGLNQCLSKCQVWCRADDDNSEPGLCGRPCSCKNHFHLVDSAIGIENKDADDLDVNLDLQSRKEKMHEIRHCCDSVHMCGKECSEQGFCDTNMNRCTMSGIFTAKFDQFKVESADGIKPRGIKAYCVKEIEKYQLHHVGLDLCYNDQNQAKKVHTCTKKCPACGYYCEKAINHTGLCNTRHGSMINTKLNLVHVCLCVLLICLILPAFRSVLCVVFWVRTKIGLDSNYGTILQSNFTTMAKIYIYGFRCC